MATYVLIPSFNVAEISALFFFLLVPAWLIELGSIQGGGGGQTRRITCGPTATHGVLDDVHQTMGYQNNMR